MTNRRHFLYAAGATLGAMAIAPVLARQTGGRAAQAFPVAHADAEWRKLLTSAQYDVLRREGTERPYSSPLNDEHRPGIFACAGCGRPLFDAATKFDSHTGWPSFYQSIAGSVGETRDASWGMVRTAVYCADCGGHLGHVFDDGPPPTGLRYCMNGVAMTFAAKT